MAEIIKLDGTRQLDFDRATVEQAYDRWAPIYDLVFGGVFSKGRRAAILATNSIGGRVLEVGVGTGISLPPICLEPSRFRHRYLGGHAAQGEGARRRSPPEEYRGSCGDGCGETRIPRQFIRCRHGAICRDGRPESGSRAGRVRPGFATRRRDYPAEPGQCGCRDAPHHRAAAPAGGASAWLSDRICLVALCAMGGGGPWGGTGRAPPGAALRTLLADSLPQGRGSRSRVVKASRAGSLASAARPQRDT